MALIAPKRPRWFIREWRKRRRWTQEKLAERSGMTKSMISGFENGTKRLNDDHIGMLCTVLDIEPYDLLRSPIEPDPIEKVLKNIAPDKRDQVARVVEALLKTG